jgi:hypothetical protein
LPGDIKTAAQLKERCGRTQKQLNAEHTAFLGRKNGKTMAKHFSREENELCKSLILNVHRVGIEPTTQ